MAGLLLPAIVFLIVFAYRFNTLGGALGGFDNDHFISLARANQLLAGEWPLRDYADASLQGAWPPLTYMASAGAQLVFGRTLLAEGVLTSTAIAVAAALTVVAGRALGVGSLLAVGAALFSVMPSVKLYGYARPLLFAAAAVVLFRYLDKPTIRRLLELAVFTAVAFLVRHDYAAYIGLGAALAIAVHHGSRPLIAAQRLLAYGALTVALLIPTMIVVNQLVGLRAYIDSARALVGDEQLRTDLRWPSFDLSALSAEPNALAWLYYVYLILPPVAVVAALVRLRARDDGGQVAKVIGLAASAALANYFLLRGNLEGRLADPAVLQALLGAWLIAALWRRPIHLRPAGIARVALAVAATAVAGVSTVAAANVGAVEQELGTGGFKAGPMGVVRTTNRKARLLRDLPPRYWNVMPEGGSMVAAAYLSRCTAPDDRVINTTYGAEFLVFGQRLPAAGQVNFVRGFYSSEAEQRQAVARARAQSVPVAFMEPEELSRSFAADFPVFGAFLQEEYVDAGVIAQDGKPFIRVLVKKDRQPIGTFSSTGLPCFR